uniref:Kinesin-like protein n=1 Tax=Trichobilharzia regenti TaxID=157069 RepID=A0AA85K5Y0_TRIRE|nr:unnamed protein product [Trichobilharzia regenti]
MGESNNPETQNVEVFCRMKPFLSAGTPCIEFRDEKTIKSVGYRSGTRRETLHVFTLVLPPDAGQETVFQKVALPIVSDVLQGRNGLLFTYGVTGSGKTYSMEGSLKNPGILPRSLDVVFNSIGQCQTKKYVVKPDGMNGYIVRSEADALVDRHRFDLQERSRLLRCADKGDRTYESSYVEVPMKALFAVFVSVIEVYNNNIYDLLQDVSDLPGRNLTTRILREDSRRNVYVHGGVEVEVKSAEEALDVFSTAQKRRRIGQTVLNAESSRSHCVFTIRLVRTGYDVKYNEAVQDKGSIVISQLCLVDLAGSERSSRTGTQGDRLKEASKINNSLMNLRKCITALRDMQTNGGKNRGNPNTTGGPTRVVPYRDARLTYLFKNFFEGDGRVAMLVCVHQAPEEYEETMHVLKFAETSQEVTTYRTPVQPIPFRTPCTQSRPRIRNGFRNSDHRSSATGSSVVTIDIDDEATQIFNEVEHLDNEITAYIDKMTNDVNALDSDPDITDLSDSEQENCDPSACESEQDSAPESERLPRYIREFMKVMDTRPLQALVKRRLDLKKRACASTEALLLQLKSLIPASPLVNETPTCAEVTTTTTNTTTTTPNNPKPVKNLVSTLSKQWESRLAQQQAEARSAVRPNFKRIDDRYGVTPCKPVERRAAPPFNPRHRRSRSVGADNGRWLEHQEVNTTPLGTLFTPNLKHRKSVTRVELKDTLNADNYLLHHQEADSDGNVETKLFKGAIIPTAGGGSAVIFNDVEVLRQTSPVHERKSGCINSPDVHLKQQTETKQTGVVTRQSATKRRYSNSSPTKRLSAESNSTQGSCNSQSTTSSAYSEISPPVKRIPDVVMNDETIQTRCRIGIDSRGGMGYQPSPRESHPQKRSKM